MFEKQKITFAENENEELGIHVQYIICEDNEETMFPCDMHR